MVREKDGQRKQRRDIGKQVDSDLHVCGEQAEDLNDLYEALTLEKADEIHSRSPSPTRIRSQQSSSQQTSEKGDSDDENGSKKAKKPVIFNKSMNKQEVIWDEKKAKEDEEFGRQLERELYGDSGNSNSSRSRSQSSDGRNGHGKRGKKDTDLVVLEEEEVDQEQRAADMARLAEVRKEREEAELKKKDEEEKAAKKKKEEKKEEKKEKEENDIKKYADLQEALLKLLPNAGDKLDLNKLNQDATSKKLLKPLLKKAAVKQLNKATLTLIVGKSKELKIQEENNVVYVTRK